MPRLIWVAGIAITLLEGLSIWVFSRAAIDRNQGTVANDVV
jgi:hypothetical protein